MIDLFGSGILQAELLKSTTGIVHASRNLYNITWGGIDLTEKQLSTLLPSDGSRRQIAQVKTKSVLGRHKKGADIEWGGQSLAKPKKVQKPHSGGRWKTYKDLCGRSPVTEYEYGPNYIRVRFGKMRGGMMKPDKTYQWTSYSLGESAIEEMKELADYGCGLAKYILANCAKKASRIY